MSDAPQRDPRTFTTSSGAAVEVVTVPHGDGHRPAVLHRPAVEPTGQLVINLHGAPGAPLTPISPLADALSPHGAHVLRFNYSGLWGNPGTFDLSHALDDLGFVLDFVTSDAARERYGLAPTSVQAVGFAFGAALGLLRAREDDRLGGVAALAPCDHGRFGEAFDDPHARERPMLDAMLDTIFGEKGPVEQDPEVFRDDLVANRERFSFLTNPSGLMRARLLLLAGIDDLICPIEEHALPLYRELRRLGHPWLELDVLQTDHGFGAAREGLYERVARWIVVGGP